MAIKTYNPKRVVVSFLGQTLTGFAPGTFIRVEYDEDAFSKYTGADGESARVQNANEGGNATCTLMQTSQSNDTLSALAIADRASGTAVGPFMVKDLSGTTLCLSPNAWVKKIAGLERGKEATDSAWEFDLTDLKMVNGGNS